MKILIIEDEKAVSNDLCATIFKVWKEVQLPEVDQVYSVKEATAYLKEGKGPDLIFSDIQLGDGTCFDIFKQTDPHAPIIFCTAYDDYAIQAFRENGIDYILKPFTRESIRDALQKYENIKKMFAPEVPSVHLEQLLKIMSRPHEETRVSSVLVYFKDKIIPIKLEEIALFYLEEDETHLLTLDGVIYFPGKSLDELEKMTGTYFFRANRQFLVSRQVIDSAYQFFSRKLALTLNVSFPEKIIVSKEKKTAFLNWLSQRT